MILLIVKETLCNFKNAIIIQIYIISRFCIYTALLKLKISYKKDFGKRVF